MRGVGGDDRLALLHLPAIGEVGAHEHEPGELALRARGRLERDGVQPAHFGEDPLQAPHELEGALGAVLLLERMEVAEPGQRDHPLVHARVVLHRAGAQRVETRVDSEGAVGERREVAHDLGLGELGEPRRLPAAELLRHLCRGEVVARQRPGAPTLLRLLEDRASRRQHLRQPVDVAGERFSVTQTRRASSIPA